MTDEEKTQNNQSGNACNCHCSRCLCFICTEFRSCNLYWELQIWCKAMAYLLCYLWDCYGSTVYIVVLCEREKVNQNPSLRGWFVVKQIILNYLVIFVLPLISGGCVRFFCRKWSKAWLVTVVPALLATAAYAAACDPPVPGSESYGLQTVQLCCFTIASLIVGLIFRKKKK